MKYLLIATLVFYGLTWWAYRVASRAGDNFGAAVPVIICCAVSAGLTIVYLALALWWHRFL